MCQEFTWFEGICVHMSIEIHNEDCFETMTRLPQGSVGTILTSPPYNTNRKMGRKKTVTDLDSSKGFSYLRYDTQQDTMTNGEYVHFTLRLFDGFNRILAPNGCVLYNMSYGTENTEAMIRSVSAVVEHTPFTVADIIVWKKPSAMPVNQNRNRLTRICEFVYVFCRKSESATFNCNKKVTSVRKTGQRMYESITNFVEARNNDGPCPYNKATYSTELCEKLLSLYATEGSCVYDPFSGSGTTAVACKKMGLPFVGSELSANQVAWSLERLGAGDAE